MTKQRIPKAILALLTGSALVLAGCDSGTSGPKVNEETMGAAVDQYLATTGGLCLKLTSWPQQVSEFETQTEKESPAGLASQMSALARSGLVSETQGEVDSLVGSRKAKVRYFTLTDEGKKFWRPDVVANAALAGPNPKVKGDLCFGDMVVAKVVKLDPVPEAEPVKAFNVRYLYKINGLAEWAKKEEFQKAFPGAAKVIANAEKEQKTHGVKVTDQGLEPRGLHHI